MPGEQKRGGRVEIRVWERDWVEQELELELELEVVEQVDKVVLVHADQV